MIERRKAVRELLADRGELIVVAGLGSPCYDVRAAGDHPLDFYNWGAMGSAVMVGLGLALPRPAQPVLVLVGDGEMLMGMGSLATLAQHKPANLTIVILDNEEYAETGMQETATAFGVDLSAVAAACAAPWTRTLRAQQEVSLLKEALHRRDGLKVAVLKIAKGDVPRTVPMRDGVAIKMRFRSRLFGAEIDP